MNKSDQLWQRIHALFDTQKLAVLCTQHKGQPYASLVAFLAADDLKKIYFATPNTTRKFANLTQDHRVAVLINDSSNQSADFHRAISVTAVGTAQEVGGPEKKSLINQYLEKHPHLEDFVHSPTCALVQISVKTYYLVRNFQHVTEMHISP